ncbi:MAG: hypothetical protein M3619_00805 [Myxococcota bacterium]|nr:hypothetical protein [Myxococcota bacterium]
MTRPIFYFAHPLAGNIAGNIRSAQTWLGFLMQKEPSVCFVAPWLACVAAGADDNDPDARERGLLDAYAIVPRCDGIVLCGERISSGMARELAGAKQRELRVFDLTGAKVLPWRDWRGLDAYEVPR